MLYNDPNYIPNSVLRRPRSNSVGDGGAKCFILITTGGIVLGRGTGKFQRYYKISLTPGKRDTGEWSYIVPRSDKYLTWKIERLLQNEPPMPYDQI